MATTTQDMPKTALSFDEAKAALKAELIVDGDGSGDDGRGHWVASDEQNKILTFDELTKSIGLSFSGGGRDDSIGEPTMLWTINHIQDEDTDKLAKTKIELVTFMVSFYLNEMMARKHLVLAKKKKKAGEATDSSSNNEDTIVSTLVMVEHAGSATMNPISKWWSSVQQKLREMAFGMKLGMEKKLPELITSSDMKEDGKLWGAKGEQFTHNIKNWHYQYGPKGTHLYLAFVAVAPDAHKCGYGGELMKTAIQFADKTGYDIYFETAGASNKQFYEKYGCQVSGTHTLVDPSNESNTLDVYCMTRKFVK